MRIVLLLLCSILSLPAQALFESLLLLNPPPAQVFLINEGFEEVDGGGALGSGTDGYDSSLAQLESGTPPNNDYATAPAPFVGTKSLFLDGTAATQFARWQLASAVNELYLYFQCSDSTFPPNAAVPILRVLTLGSTEQGAIYLRTDGTVRVSNGSSFSVSTVGTVAASTTTHFWLHWKIDGTGDVGFSTDGTRPTSGNNFISVTGGTGTNAVQRIILQADVLGVGLQTICDHFLVSETLIGSNP